MRLKGGERYNLSEIFGANHQVVIPDIQRDFCWGLGEHRELVREFVTALLELYRSGGAVPTTWVFSTLIQRRARRI